MGRKVSIRLERSICVELFLLAWRSSTASSVIFFYKFTFDGFEIIGLFVIGDNVQIKYNLLQRDNITEDKGEIMITGFCFSTATLIYFISIFRNTLSR